MTIHAELDLVSQYSHLNTFYQNETRQYSMDLIDILSILVVLTTGVGAKAAAEPAMRATRQEIFMVTTVS